jgi:hypothetical protein
MFTVPVGELELVTVTVKVTELPSSEVGLLETTLSELVAFTCSVSADDVAVELFVSPE